MFLSHQLAGNDQFCVIWNNEVPLFDEKTTQISISFEFYAASNHFIKTQQNTSPILIFTIFACHHCHFFISYVCYPKQTFPQIWLLDTDL